LLPDDGAPPASSAPAVTPAQPTTAAHVTLKVPANAEVWFEGTKTTTTGAVREFESPPLTPGRRYTYQVRARWKENGHEVTQTQKVEVTAGAHANASFPVPGGIASRAANTKVR